MVYAAAAPFHIGEWYVRPPAAPSYLSPHFLLYLPAAHLPEHDALVSPSAEPYLRNGRATAT